MKGRKLSQPKFRPVTIREAWDKFWENRKWVFINEINETTR